MGMEFCEFGTAAQFIGNLNPNKKGDEALIWNFIYDTASGLQYLHEIENVVHQDIKPDNVMINSDGTKGAHWTLEETTSMAKNEGITFQHFNEYDWFYVINMIYSDFYKVFGSNTNMYVKTALEWLTDADVKAGKAYRYYVNVVDVA